MVGMPQISGEMMPGAPDNGQQGMQGMMPQGEAPQRQMQPGGQMQQGPQGRQQKGGKGRTGRGRGSISFDQLVKDGTISQETCDAIKAYMEEKNDLLKELLANNIITQEEYDAITAAQNATSSADTNSQDAAAPDENAPQTAPADVNNTDTASAEADTSATDAQAQTA